ncbi:MFS transporter [Actinokineospora sp. PR83]|uniref:MFS transporter n=1 Tax=Actinokineospora sp. PR83 TaxID=2884908 RepID=UPI001F247258|nr:MFS transporter [Actinokineospora sp. PR83]MCG8916040.1 MFS transporter [Actinokineospora sp. PR83]
MASRPRRFTGVQRFLLASSFVTTLGSFAVLPYMSVLLERRLGFGLGTVGTILAVASLIQFAGCVVGAGVAEWLGLQRTLLVALVLHVAGFAGFLAGLHWPAATVAGLISISSGSALYLPAAKAYLVAGVDDERRPLLLSASSSALNSGLALGPLLAGPFVLDSSGWVFGVVIVLFAAMTVGHALLPREAPQPAGQPWRVLSGIAVMPFAVTALTLYLHMFFYYFLPVYTVPRASPAFYGAVLMAHSIGLVVLQPLLARRVGRMGYPAAILLGFAAMATGMAVLATGGPVGIAAGTMVICLGESVLFLKNDLEALARSRRSSAVVFGQQRLAFGLGSFVSSLAGGAGYAALDGAGRAPVFWLVVAAQCVLLPLLLLAATRVPVPRARMVRQT